MSGTWDGAGGVGGLLAVTRHARDARPAETYWATMDLNGNVIGLASTTTTRAAVYEYDAFRGLLRVNEPEAGLNPIRFSTKYRDEETDLDYYGYRYYSARLGRWLPPDPMGEKGGINLYGICHREPNEITQLHCMYHLINLLFWKRLALFVFILIFVPRMPAMESVEQLFERLNLSPISVPKSGFTLRWITRDAFTRPKCVTLNVSEETISIHFIEYELGKEGEWGKIIFESSVTDASLLETKILNELGSSPNFWQPLTLGEEEFTMSGTDGPSWWFEHVDSSGTRKRLAVGDLRLLKGLYLVDKTVRNVECYFEVQEVLKDALIRAGLIGWHKK